MILQPAKVQEKELFFPSPVSQTYSAESKSLPSPLVLFSISLESAITHEACISDFSTHFP